MFFTDPEFLGEFGFALTTAFWMIFGIAAIFAIYLVFSAAFSFIHGVYTRGKEAKGFGSLKTVTFGDESSVVANRVRKESKATYGYDALNDEYGDMGAMMICLCRFLFRKMVEYPKKGDFLWF